ncbi:MAG: MFS transporter, partial [Aureliella sp.]
AYFGVVTGNYGVEIFLPSILEDWYGLGTSTVTKLAMIPSVLVIVGQLFIGWSSDHYNERRWHAIAPIVIGALGLIFATLTQGNLWLTVLCFTIAATGMKSYMPAFWALPNMYLTAAAAAGSIGLINSVGNLGGFLGPTVVGKVKTLTGSYDIGIYFLAATCLISTGVIYSMPFLHRRWSELKGTRSRVQALGALAMVVIGLFVGCSWWVQERLKPWGVMRQDVVASTEHDSRYVGLLADSLDDWFDKKPKIRDVLVMRLDELKSGCETLIAHPPEQLKDTAQREALTGVLSQCVKQLETLRSELKTRNLKNDNRYAKSVSDGLAEADEIVRNTQQSLRDLARST